MALFYALQEQGDAGVSMFPTVLPLVRRAFTLVTTQQGDLIYPISLPAWFDPCLLLRKDTEFDGVANKTQDVWRLGFAGVSVAFLSDDACAGKEQCVRQATLWDRLRHPNVLALETASFIGTPFIVYARGTALDEFLRQSPRTSYAMSMWAKERRRFKWTRLYEAALGLQYLHSRDVAFVALTIQDLLVVGNPGWNDVGRNDAKCQVNCVHAVSLR